MSERPPVEQLSDVAWARVERGVFSRIESTVTHAASSREVTRDKTHGWLWVAVPLAAAAAAALAFFGHTDAPATQTAEQEPARVVAGTSPSAVTFADAHITLDAQSAITMDQKAGKPVTTLEYGGAWFEVAPRGNRAAFEVVAGDLDVKVIGTKFRVARSAEHVEVAVDHGAVEVHYQGKLVTLHDHDQWTSDDLSFLEQPTTATPSETDYQAVAQHETIRGYLDLARGQGHWAEVSLYAAARLAADQHDGRAQALIAIYLHRYPSGANATDARQLLTRLKGE